VGPEFDLGLLAAGASNVTISTAMDLILRQGRIVDPSQGLNEIADLGVDHGHVAEIAHRIPSRALREVDARGLIIMPGFIDMHVHLREPGKEEAETIESGTKAAARGGFTAVACMPNTRPVNDSAATTSSILARARQFAAIPVYPIGAITRESRGEMLAEIDDMVRAGIVAISDDGNGVQNNRLMLHAMRRAKACNIPVIDHCEDRDLAAGGCIHEGKVASMLGLSGIDPAAEEIQIARDAVLAQRTGARVHIAHISTLQSLEIVKQAKRKGIAVTCEVTPHHLLLTEERAATGDTNAKMNPPLRTQADTCALIGALASGDIDVIATDHAPHTAKDKALSFDRAPFGVIGLETAVGLIVDRLVRPGTLSLEQMAQLFALHPARILGLERGTLAEGAAADITVIDPEQEWEIRSSEFLSRSRNTPFEGWRLCGGPAMTVVNGQIAWSR
jgi:dihydroorotase